MVTRGAFGEEQGNTGSKTERGSRQSHSPIRIQDYLYRLSEAIQKLAPASHDSHLEALDLLVRGLDAKNTAKQ